MCRLNTLYVRGPINLYALRFWVRVWRFSHVYGCFGFDASGPPSPPYEPTIVSEPWLDFMGWQKWDPSVD